MSVTVFHLAETIADRDAFRKAAQFPEGFVEVTNLTGLHYCWAAPGVVEVVLDVSPGELATYAIDESAFRQHRIKRHGDRRRENALDMFNLKVWRVPSPILNRAACRLLTERAISRHLSGQATFPSNEPQSDEEAMHALDVLIDEFSTTDETVDGDLGRRLSRFHAATTLAVQLLTFCLKSRADKKWATEFQQKIDRLRDVLSAPTYMLAHALKTEAILEKHRALLPTIADDAEAERLLLNGNSFARSLHWWYTIIDASQKTRDVIKSIVETIQKVRGKGPPPRKGTETDGLFNFIVQKFQENPRITDRELLRLCLAAGHTAKARTIRKRIKDKASEIEKLVRPMSENWTIAGYSRTIPKGRPKRK